MITTNEEYRQMVLEEKIKYIQQKKRIEMMKPKKMLYTANPSISISNNKQPSYNFKKMNFH
jgi:hypothetical protein